jgi:phosphatidylserine decarboxylase
LSSGDFRQKVSHIPLAREGVPYVFASVFVTLVFAILGYHFLTWLFLGATLLIGHFFRDPERIASVEPPDVVSPADGKVIAVKQAKQVRFVERPAVRISIFMSVFDVHVNRIPYSGVVRGVHYQKGGFQAANSPAASERNERNWVWIQTDSGLDIVLTQVAGLIARRIVCWPRSGDGVLRGERFGMIRFGSRVDVYVPEGSEILVSEGSRVYAGETVLCRLK